MRHGGITVLAGALALSAAAAFAQQQEGAGQPSAPQPPAAPPQITPPAPGAPTAARVGRTITGRVIDANTREPIPLATVMVKATPPIRIEADLEGRFTITGLPQETLTVRGFAPDYLPLDIHVPLGEQTVTIALFTSYTEEVVVVGRATEVSRKHLANSVATVNSQELVEAPAQTLDEALQGKIAGANIQSNAGAPGGGIQLRMRGVSTINGRSEPLYVVDGILVSDVAVSNGINAVTKSNVGSNPAPTQDGQVNRIADLNPEDIESIEVLKGASAAAIYGSKASNGVVIITTKRGRPGTDEPRLTFSQRVGTYQLSNKLGTRRFNSLDDAVEAFGPLAANYFQPGRYFDHEEELAGRMAPSVETAASIAGAAGPHTETRYFASGTFSNDEGIIQRTGHQRQTLRLNLDRRFGERLDLHLSTALLHTLAKRGIFNNDNSSTSSYMVFASTPSFLDLRQRPDGSYPTNPFITQLTNPLQTAALMKNHEDVWRLLGAVDGALELWRTNTQELKLTGVIGADRFQQTNDLFFPPELNFEPVDDGLLGTSLSNSAENLNLNGGINLVHTFRPGAGVLGSFTSSIGFQQEERRLDTLYVISRNQNAGMENVDTGTQLTVRQRREFVRDRGAYLQEEAILFDDRLSLTAAIRADQSSVNGDPNKFFLYPKGAAAFRVPGMPRAIDELKLRAAYGEAGNLPLYGQKFTALTANRNIDGNPGVITAGIAGDSGIVPERQREIEAGVDLVAFDGDGLLELTVYQRNISDLLLERTLAPSTGYLTQFLNGGSLRNRGVEVMLQAVPVKSSLFQWKSRVGFALNRSEITSLPVPAFNTGGFGVSLGSFRIEKGASATQIVGNDGALPDGTCCVVRKLGDTEPTFRMSFLNGLGAGPFRLNVLVDWQQGSSIINLTRFLYDLALNTPDFEAGKERRRQFSENFRTGVYIEDATFVKLREVSLTYELPTSLWARAFPGLKSARLTASGRNLLTFTGYSGLDPEVSNFGNQPIARNIDVAPFPPSRSYWGSIELGF